MLGLALGSKVTVLDAPYHDTQSFSFFIFHFSSIIVQPGMVTTDLLMSGATTKQVGTVNICFFLVVILLFLISS